MVKQFLKIAGVKTQSEFYKKYPTEAAFFRAHPEAKHLQKMSYGGGMYAYANGGEPVSSDYPDYRTFKAAHDAWEASQNSSANDGLLDYTLPTAGPTGLPDYLLAQQQPPTAAASQVAPKQRVTLNPYEGVSIYDMLTAQGKAGDYQSRKQLAKTLGIEDYRGTPGQNKLMMEMIRQNPDVLIDYTEAPQQSSRQSSKSSSKSSSKEVSKPSSKSNNPPAHVPLREEFGNAYNMPEVTTSQKPVKKYAKKSDEYIDKDPYFFAEEGDNAFIKAIDAPFTWLRNQGAKIVYDRDLGTAAKVVAAGAGAGLLSKLYDYFKPRYEPYNPKQLPGAGKIKGQKALPPSQKALPPSSPRGWTMGEGSYRSPNFPFHQTGGSYNPTSVDYGQGLPEFAMGYSMPEAMYGLGMEYGGMYEDGGSPLYSTQGQTLRNFTNTLAYTPGGWSPNHVMMPPVGFNSNVFANGGIVKGGEYDMSEDQIQDLINQGYKIEYI